MFVSARQHSPRSVSHTIRTISACPSGGRRKHAGRQQGQHARSCCQNQPPPIQAAPEELCGRVRQTVPFCSSATRRQALTEAPGRPSTPPSCQWPTQGARRRGPVRQRTTWRSWPLKQKLARWKPACPGPKEWTTPPGSASVSLCPAEDGAALIGGVRLQSLEALADHGACRAVAARWFSSQFSGARARVGRTRCTSRPATTMAPSPWETRASCACRTTPKVAALRRRSREAAHRPAAASARASPSTGTSRRWMAWYE